MKTHIYLLCIPLLFTPLSHADEDMAELQALLSVLDEETEIATKTKMNADYVPGMVTVLHGQDLETLGIRNVWEALSLVSGMDGIRSASNQLITQVRGAGFGMLSGNLKVLVDSIAVNNNIDGYHFAALSLPISQIERVEVIRGPGGAIHGEFAYSGVVNIITRKQDNLAYIGWASHDTLDAGAAFNWQRDALQLYGNVGGMDSDGSRIISGLDGFAIDGAGYSPGPIDDRENNQFALLGVKWHDYTLRAHFMQREAGGYYGGRALPPPTGVDESRNQNIGVSLQREWLANDDLQGKLQLLWQRGEVREHNVLSIPAGAHLLFGIPPRPLPATAPFDGYERNGGKENRYEVETQWIWRGWQQHTWLLSVAYAHLELDKTWTQQNFIVPDQFFTTPLYLENEEANLPAGATRDVFSMTVQDQLALTPDLDITAGLRYDRYSDVDDSVTPRLAGVWRVRSGHILKAQYAEAFRPPDFNELYLGGFERDLRPETLDAIELGYIYRDTSKTLRMTLFQTTLHNLLQRRPGPAQPNSFVNAPDIDLRGIEWEWEHRLTPHWRVFTNVSYLETAIYDRDIINSSEWLANIALLGRLAPSITVGARWRYVGAREIYTLATPTGPVQAPDLEAYQFLDLAVHYAPAAINGLRLSLNVDDVWDEEFRYLSNPSSYRDHLRQPGRSVGLQLRYLF